MAKRVPCIFNPNYKRSGPKSYVWLMSKYGFNSTQPGPYFVASKLETRGKHGEFYAIHKRHESHKKHPASSAGASAASGQPASTAPSGTTPASGSGSAQSSQISAQDIQLDSEYLCPVGIGTPAQTLMLDFDTGSSDLWCWSTELSSSVQSTGKAAGHNIFDSSKSSTWKPLSGSTWQISYGDGSSASGDVGTDVVTLGSVVVNPQAVETAKTMSTQFQQGAGDGLLGLAWPSINTIQPQPQPTPVANMISQQDIPQSAELFTAYLGSWRDANDPDKGDSWYTFGEIDQSALNGQTPAYTPIDNSQGFWMFNSTQATLNGKTLTRPSGNTAIADTGTTLCLIDTAACKAVYAAIEGSKYDSTQQGYVYPSNLTADQLPDVALAFGDTLIHIQKEELGFADAGNGMVFGGIQDRGTNPFDILGDVCLKNAYVVFDQGNQRLGVVQRTEPTQNLAPPPAEGGGGS